MQVDYSDNEISNKGRGGDKFLAHVMPGNSCAACHLR